MIRFEGICKSYGGVCALDHVSFAVRAGCVHALVGENGAGKSTLMKILAGAVRADGGRIEIDGRPVEIRSPRAAQDLGVAIVYQEFNLAPHLSVSENVYLGRWQHHRRLGLISFQRLARQTAILLRELGVDLPVHLPVERLSVAQQQMVEIAKALSLDARILILDEPSAVLTPPELAALFRVVRGLTERGVCVLYISHRLDEIFELADAVTVLRDGRTISTRPIRETRRDELIRETVGRALDEEFPARQSTPGDRVLDVRDLCVDERVRDVTFDVRAGEVFVLTGMVGSGRSSVGRALFGAAGPIVRGVIELAGRRVSIRDPRSAIRNGIAYIPEDRKREGLLLARPVRENITLGHWDEVRTRGLLRPARERAYSAELLQRLHVRSAGVDAPASSLSGGNQQKTLLARWLQRPYRVMILDEPTRGVDIGAKVEIYRMINDLAARGTAVMVITSELPEAIGMGDRIGVMARGRLAGILDNRRTGQEGGSTVTQEAILRLAVGEA